MRPKDQERFNLISLYGMASQLLQNYVVKDRAAALAEWFIAFESYRRVQDKLASDEADNEMVVLDVDAQQRDSTFALIREAWEFNHIEISLPVCR
jgi:hypothetical protein